MHRIVRSQPLLRVLLCRHHFLPLDEAGVQTVVAAQEEQDPGRLLLMGGHFNRAPKSAVLGLCESVSCVIQGTASSSFESIVRSGSSSGRTAELRDGRPAYSSANSSCPVRKMEVEEDDVGEQRGIGDLAEKVFTLSGVRSQSVAILDGRGNR